MKKSMINLKYDQAKLKALECYLPQNGTTVEDELQKHLDSIYDNQVPEDVKKFINFQYGENSLSDEPEESQDKPSRRQKTSVPKEEAVTDAPVQSM